jgi:hypothetical protein
MSLVQIQSVALPLLLIMTQTVERTHTQKDGTVWTWEQTLEFALALDHYNRLVLERRLSEDK